MKRKNQPHRIEARRVTALDLAQRRILSPRGRTPEERAVRKRKAMEEAYNLQRKLGYV